MAMQYRKLVRTTVFDETVDYIKRAILNQELKAGERLPSESTMAAMMGVGRGTVREALQVLIHAGLLTRSNKVTSVAPFAFDRLSVRKVFDAFPEHHDIMEVIELRKIIEPEAAALAAEKITAEGTKELERHYRLMEESRDDLELFSDHDNRYHITILQATGNSLVIDIIKSIQAPMRRSQSLLLQARRGILPRSLSYHEKILAALKNRDRALARKNMLYHILDIEKEIYAFLLAEQEKKR
jgi:GntR family transcriptional repressor for pyruvate dehydrogenase complex